METDSGSNTGSGNTAIKTITIDKKKVRILK